MGFMVIVLTACFVVLAIGGLLGGSRPPSDTFSYDEDQDR